MIEKMMEVDLVQIAVNDMQVRLRMYRRINEEECRSSSSSLEEMDTEVTGEIPGGRRMRRES